jgi:hypothetical protein
MRFFRSGTPPRSVRGEFINSINQRTSLVGLGQPFTRKSRWAKSEVAFRWASVLCRIPALLGEKIFKNQFSNKFQYSNSKNQTENKSVCDLKFGFDVYLEIGLWKFGRARLQRRVQFQDILSSATERAGTSFAVMVKTVASSKGLSSSGSKSGKAARTSKSMACRVAMTSEG